MRKQGHLIDKLSRTDNRLDTALINLWNARNLLSDIKGQESVVYFIEVAIVEIARKRQ